MFKSLHVFMFLVTSMAIGQNPVHRYFDPTGQEVSQLEFETARERFINFPISYEQGNRIYHYLFSYKTEGHIDLHQMTQIYNYLNKLFDGEINRDKALVISYVSAHGNQETSSSNWNIFSNSYNRKLRKRDDVQRLWMHSPDLKTLKYFRENKYDWKSDEERLFESMFFPLNVPYGGFLILRPDGYVYIQLHEHSYKDIVESVDKILGAQ